MYICIHTPRHAYICTYPPTLQWKATPVSEQTIILAGRNPLAHQLVFADEETYLIGNFDQLRIVRLSISIERNWLYCECRLWCRMKAAASLVLISEKMPKFRTSLQDFAGDILEILLTTQVGRCKVRKGRVQDIPR